ncbi:cytochrome P450 oxidoreductase OrdA-like protein [Xylaria cubensis]|nr:cytochrome P450 oxidoreductase OrdA-like protein [Xylaria cubensis]
MFTIPVLLIPIFLGIALIGMAKRTSAKMNSRKLPPGPRPWPLLGNILDLPPRGKPEWEHWLKHKDLYGPISSVVAMGTTFIIVHSANLAFELLERRSAIYSSRPRMVFVGEMCGWEKITAFLPYGEKLRAYRRRIFAVFGTKGTAARFFPLQENEVNRFLLNTLEQPQGFLDHIKSASGAIILKLTYGYSVKLHEEDPLVDLANKADEQVTVASVPGAWLVDTIPALRHLPEWLPGSGFKTKAKEWKKTLSMLADQPLLFAKRQMVDGIYEPSYVSSLYEAGSEPKTEEEESLVKWSAASMYAAGADTSKNTINTFFLAMILRPEIQEKAREEIDRVVGTKRLPTFDDRPYLPYIEAITMEAYRWHPVIPLGLPHMATESDECNGYFIPKGAMVIPNIWWFTHDPELYHKPESFDPSRFIDPSSCRDPRDFVFGFGRRACPGKLLADSTVWLTIACTLAVFDIGKPMSETGEEIEPEAKFTPGLISHTVAFGASVQPRSSDHEALIRQAAASHPRKEGIGGERQEK